MSIKQPIDYTFGPLRFRVLGLGVFTGCKYLSAACDRLTPDELRAANREAWKQKRSAVRVANRQSNVTIYGWNDRRDQLIDVAEVVIRETWKRMARAAA